MQQTVESMLLQIPYRALQVYTRDSNERSDPASPKVLIVQWGHQMSKPIISGRYRYRSGGCKVASHCGFIILMQFPDD